MALIGVALYLSVNAWYQYQQKTNPDAFSALPPVSKQMAENTALKWYQGKFGSPAAEAESTVYITDKKTEAYLEKNGLADEYEKKFQKILPLDFWRVTLKAAGGERIYIRVGMDEAKVYGFQSVDPYRADVLSMTGATPQQALQDLGYRPDDFQVELAAPQTGSRDDELFLVRYSSKTVKIGAAQLVIGQNGNQQKGITEIVPFFQLPDDFLSWLKKQDSGAALYSVLYMAGALIFGIVGLILIIIKRKNSRFSRGILFSLVFLSAIGVYTWNSIPAQTASVEPKQLNYVSNSFLFFSSMILYVLLAVSVYFNAVAGDMLWRERGWNPWLRWKDASFGRHVYASMGRGYLLAIFVMGVQQVLFLFALGAFHSFSVSDPSQSMDNLYWPWLFPSLAWYAGIGEEIAFRLFGIALFRKILPEGRSPVSQQVIRFLSVLLPALIWAAGHASYAFYPNYTRLFEVTALGIVFGYVFLRYGLYTAIFTHVSMDIVLMSLAYMAAVRTPGSILLGVFYMATPFLVAAVILFLHRNFHRAPAVSVTDSSPALRLYSDPETDLETDPDRTPNP